MIRRRVPDGMISGTRRFHVQARRDSLLVILEGPDGAGKSTLSRELAASLRAAYPADSISEFHKGPPHHHPLVEYEQPLFHYRPGTGRHIICDRWHVGEAVYPEVLGRATS